MFPLKVTFYNVDKLRNGFLFQKAKTVPEQRSENCHICVCSRSMRTTFLSNHFWSPRWKFNTLFSSMLPRLLPVNQSVQKRGWRRKARAGKLSQHSWRNTAVGTDFVHQAVFFSSHRPIPCTWEMLCLMFFFFLPYFRIAFATPNPPINLKLCYLYRDLRAQCDTTACWVWGMCSYGWYL